MKLRARPYSPRRRLMAVGTVLAVSCAVLLGRAAWLQLVEQDFYQQQGDARFLREVPIPTSRGMITDRNGEPLAISSPVESVWANPKELLQHPDRLPELAAALDIPRDTLEQRIAQRADKEFVYLRRHMNPDIAEAVVGLGIPGVYSQREFRRFYPHGEVMAHVLGFTNIDDQGQEGLELAFEDWLSGEPGSQRVIRDRRGRVVEYVDLVKPAEPGRDLTLSIDRRLQYLAYRELKTALVEHGASSGSVVVLDVATGEILAMVNLPSYNPNARDGGTGETRRNRAVTDVVEPGSVMKTFTLAAALESGKFTPDTPIQTAPGYMPLPGGYTVKDYRNYGVLTLTGVLTKSSNVGATRIAAELGNAHQYDMYRRFGLGQPSGSGFPGESAGVLRRPETWGPTEKATISYGYGLSVTPLQLARAYAAIGNGGRLHKASFVKGARDEGVQVVDPVIARQLMTMMETVTGPEGTARRAAVLGYRVAGKTGTSRKASGGGYAANRYAAVFVGLVPASRPRFATAVVIHEPQGLEYGGGAVSAPVFHRVMDGALRLMDVPPDAIEQWYAARAARQGRAAVVAARPREPLE
ncbi:peptidoglycan D,D-transpeptidase FtsI family protein [Arenimonas fontis]|uniref:Peptidoglycan D,D-transpeptidase FtsI n=1 Tax=Arenimonas fontis TaxID=2608255 RepID=A0A5B2Z886_9GAMM|nr:penicillin-binding protein 2 [Arenimonas fontis]